MSAEVRQYELEAVAAVHGVGVVGAEQLLLGVRDHAERHFGLRYQQAQARIAWSGGVEQSDGCRVEGGHQVRGGRRRDAVEQDAVTLYTACASSVDELGQWLAEKGSESRLGPGHEAVRRRRRRG
ncbi:hypothetical protein ACIRL0_08505 [Streptomyces sp. NPDC102365]|uniref:hypothetical protein n=1 Tax=Streptomyces sp. NPDC102365 TaxID=3366162 RepID=UPI003809D786